MHVADRHREPRVHDQRENEYRGGSEGLDQRARRRCYRAENHRLLKSIIQFGLGDVMEVLTIVSVQVIENR